MKIIQRLTWFAMIVTLMLALPRISPPDSIVRSRPDIIIPPPVQTVAPISFPETPELPLVSAAPFADNLAGIWQSEGESLLFEIEADKLNIYEISQVSCLKVTTGVVKDKTIETTSGDITVEKIGQQLILTDEGTYAIAATNLKVPERCENGGTAKTQNAIQNFEVLWHTFNENYAFFELREVNWQRQYDLFRPQVAAISSEQEFFDLMSAMLAPLDDGHVGLFDFPFRSFSVGTDPLWNTSIEEFSKVINQTYLRDQVNVAGTGNLLHGRLSDAVGYLNIQSMIGFAGADGNESASLTQAMDQVLQTFAEVEVLIVDLRFNQGGLDSNARLIAGRFADQKRFAFSKQIRNGDAFTDPQAHYLEPAGKSQFTKPVIVLASRLTFSAAETLVMYLRPLPNVTIIGERTGGGLSDRLTRELPNGWIFSLSHQKRLTADGQLYEGRGLPPDIEAPFKPTDFLRNRDPILETALALIVEEM